MSVNPFEVTKAVDFTDDEIAATWVDLPGGGVGSVADPRSPMPKFIVGGKGGGRTHLLRYFSYPLQKLRHQGDVLAGIRSDGYVGIFSRCSGLNSSRFAGKRQDTDTWASIFSYYSEVWLGRLTIDLIRALLHDTGLEDRFDREGFAKAVLSLFDTPIPAARTHKGLRDLAGTFEALQRELDFAINNVALSHRLDLKIGASPGKLVFGIPTLAAEHIPQLENVRFAYLLDEYENLKEDQQRYVNTLVREKRLPTTFLVGSQRYGLRTHATLNAGEENRRDSEYDLLVLEDAYRSKAHSYLQFCGDIARKRLAATGVQGHARRSLDEFFVLRTKSLEAQARVYTERLDPERRPWLVRLDNELRQHGLSRIAEQVLRNVMTPDSPLHEKFTIFLVYRAWASKQDLVDRSQAARIEVDSLRERARPQGKAATTYRHYRADLYAQLLEELGLPQEYYGFDEFVRMSGYLPRNLIVLLKQITRWSMFLGESPFRGGQIGTEAQREGTREASEWFLSSAKGLGRIGENTQLAIRRLGTFFRAMRFSQKPVEVSCSAFATDRQGLSASALRVLDEATSHSVVLEVPKGRKERNIGLLQHKYHLNPMLAPLFGLSLALRGVASFTTEELNAIFDPDVTDADFGGVMNRRLIRMRPPFHDAGSQSGLLF